MLSVPTLYYIAKPGRPRGGVVTQRSAKPCTPVQFRAWPPAFAAARLGARPQKSWHGTLQGLKPFVIGRAALSGAVFPGSSVVEQPAVNRLVAGSNPARGAKFYAHYDKEKAPSG